MKEKKVKTRKTPETLEQANLMFNTFYSVQHATGVMAAICEGLDAACDFVKLVSWQTIIRRVLIDEVKSMNEVMKKINRHFPELKFEKVEVDL